MLRTAAACVTALTLAACGGEGGEPAREKPAANAAGAATPALGRQPVRKGEIIVKGEASPETHGPFELDGRYLVRFEQFAPEDPDLDFAAQTPLSVSLTPREGDQRGAVKLLEESAARGRRVLTLGGRYYVDVSFGDFPYVIRLTPRAP